VTPINGSPEDIMTKAQIKERDEAREQLRQWIKPGDTVYCILRHVSRSGMQRRISLQIVRAECSNCHAVATPDEYGGVSCERGCQNLPGLRVELNPFVIDYWVSRATSTRLHKDSGLIIGGCGMDMGFALVYELSHALYGDGYACLGKGADGRRVCPSSYHSNHHDTIQCPGIGTGDDRVTCYRPYTSSRYEVRADWPRKTLNVQGETIDAGYLACIDRGDDQPLEVCPTCKGESRIPNPNGPERFDLTHTDGYAIKHAWL
jgi:hypothetical protein